MHPIVYFIALSAAAPAVEASSKAGSQPAVGGPFEPVEFDLSEIVVEVRKAPPTIAPDPALQRRYAPRERDTLNAVTIRF